MATLKRLGELERAVMDQLWDTGSPQTVREVHSALRAHRALAYTTVMTVLQRLSCKDLVVQIRDHRAYHYAPTRGRDELMASLMVDVLDQVSDTGGGIPKEDLSRVFSRLYRAENTLIQGVGDTGVGLSIAKTLTDAQNGRIWVDTEIGVGSTFSVSLPLHSVAPIPEGA